ncbi:hypothetical protein MVEN_00252000 [Mycena venus]|uniref:NAD(P)-binding protein n=1 Tax=Mycena venus TaxID=2733690 RepID=A0A8H6YY71_9AGAR|nr:hypothetical protein MVEN_00252000 [Mycena venus]
MTAALHPSALTYNITASLLVMKQMSKGTAFVTGAARGIGKAIALRLAEDGFDVAVNDLPTSSDSLLEVVKEIKSKGRASSAHLADVSVEEDVKAMFADVVESHGGLDVMVSNAGIIRVSVEEWDRMMAVNCRGTFLCYKYAGMQMIEQGRGGRIIGAGSVAGKRVGSPFMSGYAVTKFAIHGLTQAAAMEYGPHGITVNSYGAIFLSMHGLNSDIIISTWGRPQRNACVVSFIVRQESLTIIPAVEYLDENSAEVTGAAPGTFIEFTKEWGPLNITG